MPEHPSLSRTVACTVGVAVAGTIIVGWLVRVTAELGAGLASPAPVDPGEVLTLMAAVLALAIASWLSVSVLVALAAHLPGWIGRAAGRARERWTPRLARRLAAAALGLGLGGGLTAQWSLAVPTEPPPASAYVAGGSAGPAATSTSPPTAPDPGWVPTRPLVRPQDTDLLVRTRDVPDPEVVVRRGDTLWSIARAELGRQASDAEVARWWPRWHAANEDVIGPDPDLILPGQVLRRPPADDDTRQGQR